MKKKSPFDIFVEEAERIRKIQPTDEQIIEINDLSREVVKEEAEQENTFPLPRSSPADTAVSPSRSVMV